MITTISISPEQAIKIGDKIGVNWAMTDLEQFRRGIEVELEHGRVNYNTDVTHNDLIKTGKIALAHLNEFPDYYTRLEIMERPNFPYDNGATRKNNNLLKGVVFGAGLVVIGKLLIEKMSSTDK